MLVVDDDDEVRSAIYDALVELGLQATPKPNANDALRELEHSEFDCVLTDVKMPGIDGIELCRRVSGDRPNVPVVVMTSFGDVDAAVSALRAGAFDFVTKPLAVEQLGEVLQRALTQDHDGPPISRLPDGTPSRGRVQVDVPSLDDVEKKHIEVVLRAVGGNKAEAARKLGIDRVTLYRKLARLGIEETGRAET